MRPRITKNNSSRNRAGRLVQKLTIRPVLRKRILGFSIIGILTIGLFIFFNLTDNRITRGAVNGDYRSNASGNWNSTSTWQRYNGTSWVNAIATPTSSDVTINILSGHTVTVTADVTTDQTIVDAGGTLVISSPYYVYTANGSGTDLTVNGTLTINAGGFLSQNATSTIVVTGLVEAASGATHSFSGGSSTTTINSGGRYRDDGATITTSSGHWTVNSGGIYEHNRNGSSLPVTTWNAGSTCEITGVTSTVPGNLNQSFQNFTWNCASQSADINAGAAITTVGGDFTVASTNASQLQLSSTGSTTTISGDFIQSGGTLVLSTSGSGAPTMNISGDYIQSGGTFSVVTGNGITGTVRVAGNWARTGGTITVGGDASTNAQFVFNKSGTQTFTTTGAPVTGNVDFTVNSGSILAMADNILSGRNFTLSAGGGISLGSAAGITSSGATGNIQVSGTRTFNTGADYTYNGTAAQNTGSGLPSTVRNLTLNNSNGLTLTGTVTSTNIITLTSGQLSTGANELITTNTSTTSIQGYSSSSYVVGNIRRSVSGSGTYNFPLGTSAYYELATITLSSATGFTNILGTFTNAYPVVAGYPLSNVLLGIVVIDNMINYGFWTLTPNSAMSGGTFSITLNETVSAVVTGPSYSYCVLKRTNATSSWQSTGTPIAPTSSGNTMTAGRSGLNSFGDFGIGYGQSVSFKASSLISGVAGQVSAIYKFPDVCYDVDCWVEIMSLDGGATLSSIDNYTVGNGYDEAWQPFVSHPANATSSILWKLTFKVAGTSVDTTLGILAITGVDVDGSASIKEFVEATMPNSYALYSPTTLTVTNISGSYRATSGTTGLSNIDTAQYQAMYQMNYTNMNNFLFRTGAISTGGSPDVRQHSLYFKSFMTGQMGLPVKLTYFKAQLNKDHKVDLTWATSSEVNNDHFTVERSPDARNFEAILNQPGAGNSSVIRTYHATDEKPLPGHSYYRLKQTDIDGRLCYSITQTVNNKYAGDNESSIQIISIAPNPFREKFTITFMLKTASIVDIRLINSSGMMVFKDAIQAHEGMNRYDFTDQQGLQKGIYFMNLHYQGENQVQKIVKN